MNIFHFLRHLFQRSYVQDEQTFPKRCLQRCRISPLQHKAISARLTWKSTNTPKTIFQFAKPELQEHGEHTGYTEGRPDTRGALGCQVHLLHFLAKTVKRILF